jgi:hypothetical protein
LPLSDIASVSISVSARGPTALGFGEPLIAALATWQAQLVTEYGSLSDMTAAGCPVTDPAYLAAQAIFSQQPSPPAIKVGRRALAYTQVTKLTLHSTSTHDVYAFSLRTPGGAYQAVSVPSTGVPATDVATINTAVTALAISGLTATHATTILTLTMTAGNQLDILFPAAQPCQLGANLTFQETTTDPGIATDLAAIYAADANWYGLILDNQSPAEVTAAATWTEANKKLFVANVSDSSCTDPASTTDVMYTTKNSALVRTGLIFSGTELLSFSAAAWMGLNFPSNPGSENWSFKTLAGVPADNLSTASIHAVEGKNGNVYTPVAGLNLTQFGTDAAGEFLDIPRFIDWLTNQIQIQLLALLSNSNKIPFTDSGIEAVRAVIGSVLQAGIDAGGLAATPAPFVSVPKAAAVDPINKAARNLPNVTFRATLAGAINKIQISGVVTS